MNKLDLIDKPLVPTTFSAPDLSEELLLISEAEVMAAQERRRIRAAEELQTEEALTLLVIQESAALQVYIYILQ